jgi:competence protein ComEA
LKHIDPWSEFFPVLFTMNFSPKIKESRLSPVRNRGIGWQGRRRIVQRRENANHALKEKEMLKIAVLRSGLRNCPGVVLAMLVPGLLWAGPVDLNSADADTIARELNGVGSARAQAIVDYRTEYGAFQSAEDLLNVSGIGRYILDANEGNILIENNH